MPIRQQKLHSIEFTKLKGLKNLKIDFERNLVTGIFGINGSGKSSIIHALLALYKPSDQAPNRKNFKFSYFFTPTSHTTWRGSNFKIIHSYRQDANANNNVQRTYSKVADRWNPRYTARPERDVFFIGLESCVPAIETERRESIITLTTAALTDIESTRILTNAGYILNRTYTAFNQHGAGNKKYIGLQHNGINYSSLSMGAGEQRIFRILDAVFRAPAYSLIIIDEIDLTLHTDALHRLIDVLVERAANKNLQVVFTSHREELIKRTDINIRHIYQTGIQTFCFNETNPDCITRLTGRQERSIELFVEDDMAEAIVRKVTEELGIVKHCSIKRIGAAINAFPLAMGMHLKGDILDNIAIFMDGDIYVTSLEREAQMKAIYSGTEAAAVQRRLDALSCINIFALPAGQTPEVFINNSIRALNDNSEIVHAALGINGVLDKHEYVSRIIAELGYPKQLGLSKVIDTFSRTPEWMPYTLPLRDWLINRAAALHIQ